jgi:(p)ppGpp synthase/HD superfamily hydrolase
MSEHTSNLLADAVALAARAHQPQVDKSGEPYILHPLRVMLRLREQGHRVEVQAAAVLHDVVEDTPVTLDDVADLDPAVAVLVDAMSRRIVGVTKEIYLDFIRRAASNPEARALKIADIEDNMSRLDRLRPEEAAFLAKRYERALEILMSEDIDD